MIYNDVFKCSKIDHRRIKKLHSNLSKKTGDVMFVGCRAVRDVNGPSERTHFVPGKLDFNFVPETKL